MLITVQIADAVRDKINSASAQAEFTESFTAVRSLAPMRDLEEYDELQVTVTPETDEFELASRDAQKVSCEVSIAFEQNVSSESDVRIESILKLADSVAKYLAGEASRDAIIPGAYWTGQKSDPVQDLQSIGETNKFMTVITVGYVTYDA